jgi:hypothetical protein
MDTFELCRIASERAAWSFESALDGLRLDFDRRFLPGRLCGTHLPDWLTPETKRSLNQIRGFGYAHLFLFVEQFIIQETCSTAANYVHVDMEALSALLKFTDEETKHQRMFVLVKDLIEEGLGFRPGELPNMEEVARAVCSNSSFAVYMLTLMIEWFTQRHYVECFGDDEADLDPGFVKVFRLHWTEEAQHARIDAIQLRALAASMTLEEIGIAVNEFLGLLQSLHSLLQQQDALDLASLEEAIGERFSDAQRDELLIALNAESLWTFIISGLEHPSFQAVYNELVPAEMFPIPAVIGTVLLPMN